MEEWDLYDKNKVKTGKVIKHRDSLNQDEFRLVVHICIINSSNQMLIQKRQPFKDGWPNMWDVTVGGSVESGETSSDAAERELFEEIGYKVNLIDVRPKFTINFKNGFDDFYVVNANLNLNDLKLQKTEVQKVK